MLMEYAKQVQCKRIRIISFAVAIIAAFCMSYMLIMRKYWTMILFIVILVIAVAISVKTPAAMVNQLKDATRNLHGGKVHKTILAFGDDKIEMHEGPVHINIEYSQIKKIVDLPDLTVLVMNSNSAVLVDPNGFTRGTAADFKTFIREKTGLK